MSYLVVMLVLGTMMGVAAVASNPSPFFAALGLVLVAGWGCGALVGSGGSFLSLILFLIYLGGMMVVFMYSAALACEAFPESWGNWPVLGVLVGYVVGVCALAAAFSKGWNSWSWVPVDELSEFSVLRGDVGGVALIYSEGGYVLILGAWVLLLTLFVVLELTRGLDRGALRAV